MRAVRERPAGSSENRNRFADAAALDQHSIDHERAHRYTRKCDTPWIRHAFACQLLHNRRNFRRCLRGEIYRCREGLVLRNIDELLQVRQTSLPVTDCIDPDRQESRVREQLQLRAVRLLVHTETVKPQYRGRWPLQLASVREQRRCAGNSPILENAVGDALLQACRGTDVVYNHAASGPKAPGWRAAIM